MATKTAKSFLFCRKKNNKYKTSNHGINKNNNDNNNKNNNNGESKSKDIK